MGAQPDGRRRSAPALTFPTVSFPGLPHARELGLVALDLDGTLMCPFGQTPLTERRLAAVATLQAAGVPVTFVTGRTEDYARPIAEKFGVTAPLVTYNGGRLYCPVEKRSLYQASIDSSEVPSLLRWLDERADVIAVYLGTEKGLRLVQNRSSGYEATDDYLFGTPREVVGAFSPLWSEPMSFSKAIVVTRDNHEAELKASFGDRIQVVRTHPDLFEILPGGVSKGSGVARLCEHLGIEPAKVLAVGDQENDVSTFQAVGYSVAMGDAPEAVKASARWVTANFEDEGCAMVLESLLRDDSIL